MEVSAERGNRYAPCCGYFSKKVGREFVLVNEKSGEYHTFNYVGSVIWDAILQSKPTSEIVKILCEQFDVDVEKALLETQQFIDKLQQQGLLESAS